MRFRQAILSTMAASALVLSGTGAAVAAENHFSVSIANTVGLEQSTEIFSSSKIDAKTAAKIAKLRKSDALMALFDGAPNQTVVNQYLRFFAEKSSMDQVTKFVKDTKGKHFVVQGTVKNPRASLVKGPAISSQAFPTCWKGWVAAYVYFATSSMVCGPLHLLGGVPGLICDGVFYTFGMLPDFDTPCR